MGRSMHTLHAAAALLACLFAWVPSTQAEAGGAAVHIINMVKGNLFQPIVTHVKPGDTIIFDNKDKELHALTLEGHEKLLDEEYVDPGKKFKFKVPADARPGIWPLNCFIHVDMHGKIVVDGK